MSICVRTLLSTSHPTSHPLSHPQKQNMHEIILYVNTLFPVVSLIQLITDSTVFTLLETSDIVSGDFLREACLDFIIRNYLRFSAEINSLDKGLQHVIKDCFSVV
eukprot:TRINITY_DN3193_c0_g1_i21.p1 TRINITY_DN3193_c0_g1~~TRINITY_DN3193_c0_g1_i21.p1  ORF type:complete len:105 (-),score=2.68 TRINITY_DN3193_c0_g1_i21:75-389(-)